MPADHQLEPTARVEFGEYRGDEVFLARRAVTRQIPTVTIQAPSASMCNLRDVSATASLTGVHRAQGDATAQGTSADVTLTTQTFTALLSRFASAQRSPAPAMQLRWSRWRRRHQATARACHCRRRALAPAWSGNAAGVLRPAAGRPLLICASPRAPARCGYARPFACICTIDCRRREALPA